LRSSLATAAARGIPVVLLPVGTSERGASMVAAHSGAVAGGRASWEALADAHGVHLVDDLPELLDAVELFAAGRAPRAVSETVGRRSGLAAVLDSGAERALLVDLADQANVDFAELSPATVDVLAGAVDPGLTPGNPLDVWGTGAETETLFRDALVTLAADEAVRVVALAVDLVEELDGDGSYPEAALRTASSTELPVVVLSHVPSGLDRRAALRLRVAGVPVLEGTRSGLRAVGHLLAHADRVMPAAPVVVDAARQAAWRARLRGGSWSATDGFAMLHDYGIGVAAARAADHEGAVLSAAAAIGYPVVLKTDRELAHKSEAGGVALDLGDETELVAAYRSMVEQLGPRVIVCRQVAPGVEVLLGAVRDAALGMVMVVGAGGVLTELVADRTAALPPVDAEHARALLARTKVSRLLLEPRFGPPADLDAVAAAMASFSQLVTELGDDLDAIEINPLVCSATGAVAVDVHVEVRR
jgi:acyl-CoA synthetase (NDP forming)